jgi:signal transduction histidine kinase/BarA-like signal transduction histidine kinase
MADKPLVLAVDDASVNLDMLEEVLKQDYRVIKAESGEAALEIAGRTAGIDCVLLDIIMPGLDGYEVCERLKLLTGFADVPVIFISSLDATLDKVKGFEVGGVDYVPKPIEPEEVLARVRTHVRLRAVQREYLEAKLRADQAVSAKNHFLACVSHELRTPLQVILGTAELMQMLSPEEAVAELPKFISRIAQSGEHLLSLVNDVLDITQIDADAFALDKSVFDAVEVLQPILTMMDSQFLRKQLKTSVRIAPGLPQIQGDLRKCRQVVINLIANAVKYTPEGGSIEAYAEQGADGFVRFCVQDSGMGIPPEARAKLFTDYYQVDRLRDLSLGGKGLGLALSRRLVQLHKGEMGVDAAPETGSIFWFTLPEAGEHAIVQAGEETPPARVSLELLRGRRVLVVEDDLMSSNTMCEMLALAGLQVQAAHNVDDACQFHSQEKFDVVLTDLYMEGVSGPAVVEMLRKNLKPADVPIIVTTSHADRETVRMCRARGARDLLVKPIARECLLPRLAVLFAERAE